MTEKEKYHHLLCRYRDNLATMEEMEVLFHLLEEGSLDEALKSLLNDYEPEEKPAILIPFYKRAWFKIAAAAAILLFITGTAYQYLNKPEKVSPIANTQILKNDVAPGGNKAILQLADGSTIILDSSNNGNIANQGQTKIIKIGGQLAYNSSGNSKEVLYNTISTPRGGQYQLILADGTQVWLNAASSLRFPTNFYGNERKVYLTGEGYFEVAKNANMPFKVDVENKGEIEVLGTHFNVNSYIDEPSINTTLIEGKVKVSPLANALPETGKEVYLAAGHQAQLLSSGSIKVNKNPDIESIISWKEQKFVFYNSNLKSIMRQLERWYDVQVDYEGQTYNEEFVGIISRNVNISEILKMMEQTSSVRFKIDGNKIIVK